MFEALLVGERSIEIYKEQIQRRQYEINDINRLIDDCNVKIAEIKQAMLDTMEENGTIEEDVLGFKVVRSLCPKSVIVCDEKLIPDNYITIKIPPIEKRPDKVLIKKLLNAGHEIAGCVLSEDEYKLTIKGK